VGEKKTSTVHGARDGSVVRSTAATRGPVLAQADAASHTKRRRARRFLMTTTG
jgi:hypothetical protein